MTFPAYGEYKDSGEPWLGEIPAHWNVTRLKMVCDIFSSNVDKKTVDGQAFVRLCNYTDVYYNDEIRDDMRFMEASATDDQIERFELRAGDTIFTKDSETPDDIARAALVPADLPGVICGYHLSIARPFQGTNGAFIKRYFDAATTRAYFHVKANGLTRVGLGQYAVDNAPLAFPPFGEQKAIAAFLDRETAKIDALVAEQERLIALLKEKRQAVISHAVTKGLNPGAPMKESGIEWLGKVPAHWDVAPLKFLATVQTGLAKGKDYRDAATVRLPYLRVANVQDGYLKLDEVTQIEVLEADVERYRLQIGDVLMNEGGDFDKLGRGDIWRGQIEVCLHQNHVFAVRPIRVSSEWLNLLTSSDYAQKFFILRSKQTTNLASISSSNLMELPIVMPPADEQAEIESLVASSRTRFASLIDEAQSAITLLQERRAALISAAVTGKIDVRGVVESSNVVALPTNARPSTLPSHRALIGAYGVRHLGQMGRMAVMKAGYLAEGHVGIPELAGTYQRNAAGPYDFGLINAMERGAATICGITTVEPSSEYGAVRYVTPQNLQMPSDTLDTVLGPDRARAFLNLINLLKDLGREGVEAVATLYAVWNDLIASRRDAADDAICHGVLNEWHPEKRQKFTRDALEHWLAWMRRNGLVPDGSAPRTDRQGDLFA